jgi:glycosyltransferase involved in cell wall biosynthesis
MLWPRSQNRESPVNSSTAIPNYHVHVHGYALFASQFPELLKAEGWRVSNFQSQGMQSLASKVKDLRRCDLAFTYGGRITMGKFLWIARGLRTQKIVIFWAGSDTLYAKADSEAGKLDPWIGSKIHWAATPWLAEEVRSFGIPCEYVPVNWAPTVQQPKQLPEKFSVLVYLPDMKKESLYGADRILEVARALPQIQFTVVGLRDGRLDGAPPNLSIHGWVNDMTPFYENASVLWRPVRHDGMSFMVLAALAHGRHVLWSYPFPACSHVAGAAEARKELERLNAIHAASALGMNEPGIKVVQENFTRERIREGILKRWEEIILSPSTQPLAKAAQNDRVAAVRGSGN